QAPAASSPPASRRAAPTARSPSDGASARDLPLPRVRRDAKARADPRVSFVEGEATAERPVGQPPTAVRAPPRRVASAGCCGRAFAYFPCPLAIGGRSASLLTVFLPTCSPPLSRNIARATAISTPRMAPSVPFRALLSLIINSDHSDLGQRPCR